MGVSRNTLLVALAIAGVACSSGSPANDPAASDTDVNDEDFGDVDPGPDVTAPAIVTLDPAEGTAVPAGQLVLTIGFDEPMSPIAGSIVPCDDATVSNATWLDDHHARFLVDGLADGKTCGLQPIGFVDVAANPLAMTGYLSDGKLDFAVGVDTLSPHVVRAEPAEGAVDVYPTGIVLIPGTGLTERKTLTVELNEPMLTTATTVTVTDAGGGTRTVEGVFDAAARVLTVTLLPQEQDATFDVSPLRPTTTHHVDLTQLRDLAGNALDGTHPYLGDGGLDFISGARDELLNHTCQHALAGPFVTVLASPAPTGAPDVSAPHRQYTVNLPVASPRIGYVSARFADDEGYVIYMNSDAALAVMEVESGTRLTGVRTAVPNACRGITHALTLSSAMPDVDYYARLGPTSLTQVIIYLEALGRF